MSNKAKGTTFEKEFARLLAKNGFWVRLDKGYAQTCDMIAGKNNTIYLFECKRCIKDYFDLERVECNQSDSRRRFMDCGNKEAWFAYEVSGQEIYLSKEPIKKPSNGIKWGDWIVNEHRC